MGVCREAGLVRSGRYSSEEAMMQGWGVKDEEEEGRREPNAPNRPFLLSILWLAFPSFSGKRCAELRGR